MIEDDEPNGEEMAGAEPIEEIVDEATPAVEEVAAEGSTPVGATSNRGASRAFRSRVGLDPVE